MGDLRKMLTNRRLAALRRHAENGHLNGEDYDLIPTLIDTYRSVCARSHRDHISICPTPPTPFGLHRYDLAALVWAADVALQEYGSHETARAARRAAEALGMAFRRDHGLEEHTDG